MIWKCPKCNSFENEDTTMRCTCGHELEVINYEKIGGALYLVLAGLVLTPLINLVPLLEKSEKVFSIEGIMHVSSVTFYVIFPVFLIILLIKRKKILRPIIISYHLMGFFAALFAYYLVKSKTPPEVTLEALMNAKLGVLLSIISCGIWVTYFLKSERARRTLVK